MRLHVQLPVGVDNEGTFVYRSFVSPKDQGLGGETADDPIEERTLQDGGWRASDMLIGVAADSPNQAKGSGSRPAPRPAWQSPTSD